MESAARARWRWAWFCPRCGVHNPAAAESCEGCDLEHALLNAPGASAVHACGVASPGWAAHCIGCGDPLPVGSPPEPQITPKPRARTADIPRIPRRPHRILPPSDGPAEGLTLTRHVLLERAPERTLRPEPFRALALVLLVAIAVGLFVRALATPGDGVLALAREHRVPARGLDALPLIEGLHRLLAPATPPGWSGGVERAESGPELYVVRLTVRNGAGSAAMLSTADVHLVDAGGLDVPASGGSAALARAAGLAPIGEPVAAGAEVTTLVAFNVPSEPRDPRVRLLGADLPIPPRS